MAIDIRMGSYYNYLSKRQIIDKLSSVNNAVKNSIY